MRRLALALCVAGGLGLLLFPTAGSPATQQAVDADNLRLSPSPSTNGAYVETVDGEIRLDLTRRHPETGAQIGLNENAVTTFDRLLQIRYNGSGPVTVWLDTPTAGAYFYADAPEQPIDSPENGLRMTGGDAVYVGLVLDTTDPESRLGQFDQFEIHIGAPDGTSADSEEMPVTPPAGDGANGDTGEPGSEPGADPEPPGDDDPTEEQGSEPGADPESPGDDDPTEEPSEPGPDTDQPTDDGQDDDSGSEQPPESPESSPPDPGSSGESPAGPGTGEAASDPPPELGETPGSTQVTVGGLGWIVLLVAGALLGTSTATVLRRRFIKQ